MKRSFLSLLVVSVMACTGPEGPRGLTGPDGPRGPAGPQGPAGVSPTLPVLTVLRVDATGSTGVAVATCPAGSVAVGGGADCVACTPSDPSAFMFGSDFTTDSTGFIAGCYPGCVHVTARCVSSSVGGTVVQGAKEPLPPVRNAADLESEMAPFRAVIDTLTGAVR